MCMHDHWVYFIYNLLSLHNSTWLLDSLSVFYEITSLSTLQRLFWIEFKFLVCSFAIGGIVGITSGEISMRISSKLPVCLFILIFYFNFAKAIAAEQFYIFWNWFWTADALVSSGLAKLGYIYVNIGMLQLYFSFLIVYFSWTKV